MSDGEHSGRLAGRVAVVTGGANGIGAAFAKRYAGEGAAVVIGDLEEATDTVAAIEGAGGRAFSRATDVTDQAAVDGLMAAAMDSYGSLDILLNNAGLFTSIKYTGVTDIDPGEWEQVMRVNVQGVWQCIKGALPHMRARGDGANGPGKIVSVASTTALSGAPMMAHYVSSKGAVIAMTRALARELGPDNICVNALSLGLTLSDRMVASGTFEARREAMIDMRSLKREQTVDDCVGAAVYLASADSDFVTGQSLVIDGGMVFR